MTIAVRLFGQLSLDDGARSLGPRDFGGCKPKQLFEQLLCAQGNPVSKHRLADGLWGERLPQNVEATLETYVSVLRRSLGERGRDVVITEQRAYRVALELISLDVLEFDALLERAAGAGTRAARRHLEEALALAARGDLLADEPYSEWAAPLRYHYNGKVLSTLTAAAEAALSLGDADAALVHANAALARDRFHEAAHRARILALYLLGRQHEALEAYMACRRVLDEELGLEPMPETRALQKAILAQADPARLVAAPTPPPFPTGPEVLVGRRRELDQLEDAARAGLAGGGGLLLVEGEAAIGKSTLLDALVARLEGVPIGRARCTAAESRLPYVPLASAVRDAVGDDDRLTRAVTDERLPLLGALEALVDVLREHAPLALVLDDVDRADDATIAVLAYLQRRCADLPVVILAAAAAAVEDLQPAVRVKLDTLSRDELDDDALYEQTGGHPQLVRAVLHDDARLADNLASTLLARCRDAGPFGYRVLLTASIMDSPFAAEELADVLDVDPLALVEQLEELCALGLLAPDGDAFRFRYPLLRESLRRSLTPARRRLLHARIPSTVPARLAG